MGVRSMRGQLDASTLLDAKQRRPRARRAVGWTTPAVLLLGALLPAVLLLGALLVAAGCSWTESPASGSEVSDAPAASISAADGTESGAAAEQSPASTAPPAPTPTNAGVHVGRFAPGVANEASGVASATGNPDAFFVVDDPTGTDGVVAVNANGSLLARIGVAGMSAGNAEALAGGTCGTTPIAVSGEQPAVGARCLYVGDLGDQIGRDHITIYRFAEPALLPPPDEPVPADAWKYTYPDQPQDAESLLVDTDGSLLIITKPAHKGKAVAPHRVYRAQPGGGELRQVGEFSPPKPPVALQSLLTGNVVTDAAAAPGRVLLLTYDQVVEYTAPDPTAPLATFFSWPQRNLPMPEQIQSEGIAPTIDGCGYTIVSEAGPGGGAGSIAVVHCR